MVQTVELSIPDLIEQVRQGRIPANATAKVTYDVSAPASANGHPPMATTTTEEQRNADLALFEQWGREDAAATIEEIEEERRLFDQLHKNINETRRASGMRTL